MRRTLIQFDDGTYEKLRQRAFETKQSMASVVRELVAKGLDARKTKKYAKVEDFSFVGSGASKPGSLAPVSERHDAALADIYQHSLKKK